MSTISNKLASLQNVINRIDGAVRTSLTTRRNIGHDYKLPATPLETQHANHNDNHRPDWIQAIHGSDS